MAFVLALIFNCSPTDAYWKAFNSVYMPTKDYTCTDTTVLNLLAGMFAALSDLYSVLLPCLMTRNFDLPWKQRIALNVVFSLGLIVVGASVVRTYFLRQVGVRSDVSWMIFDAYIFAQLELQLGMICASLPALRVFFRKYLLASPPLGQHSGLNPGAVKDSNRNTAADPRTIQYILNSRNTFTSNNTGAANKSHTRNSSVEHAYGSENDIESTTAPSEHGFLKGPYTSESNDVSAVDSHNQLLHSPSFERPKSTKARNFSQPLPKELMPDEPMPVKKTEYCNER
ncbi:hypothetical protein LTR37_017322 [Vermiconidia calcicola]|uniref:Uncharacterized protein n=1 Tax=Vermiconidia calcicola TaxID=1690605 RepID=A0ACC3ML81_9PEZI|nr:hypothetical protein LTR37_017322 [Vermiconidia calcicola]